MSSATIHDLVLLDLLAPSIAGDTGMQQAALALDPELGAVTAAIRLVELYARVDEISGPVLDLLAWQLHVDFWRPELTEQAKRNLIRSSIGWHRIKGTPAAVRRLCADIGVQVLEITEWWQPAGIAAGMPPYTFSVRGLLRQPVLTSTPDNWGPDTLEALGQAVWAAQNERSWLWDLTLTLECAADAPLGLAAGAAGALEAVAVQALLLSLGAATGWGVGGGCVAGVDHTAVPLLDCTQAAAGDVGSGWACLAGVETTAVTQSHGGVA